MRRAPQQVREHGKRMAREAKARRRAAEVARQIMAEIAQVGGVVVFPRLNGSLRNVR